MLTRRLIRPLAIGAAVVVIGGGAAGIVGAASSNGSAGASTGQTATAGSNARSGPAFSPSKVIPFERGVPTTSKQDGQIPANYSQGSGTIVGGTTASKATRAALAAYPGGLVDRVVKLSNGGYEVHNIGVNWPHHIFVSKSFEVVGAD